MKHVFLINPRAGNRDRTDRLRRLAGHLAAAHGLEVECLLTDRPGAAEPLARALAETGEPVRIYVCGGDGTVHEAANGIAGYENAAMTVIPSGTGNDFLKNFGPDAAKFADPENLWDVVNPFKIISFAGLPTTPTIPHIIFSFGPVHFLLMD